MASPTQAAWEKIFEHFRVREQLSEAGVCELSADQIRRIGGREPRLMTKFDTRESRPPGLRDVTILPVTNGAYWLLLGDGYADLAPSSNRLVEWPFNRTAQAFETLPFASGPASEAQALDMAMTSGLLRHFLEEDSVELTIRGRLRSPRFTFSFQTALGERELTVDGVQVEVDSGLEGERIHLIEAKLGTRTNFHLRQLYYPWRMWSTLVATKPVSTVFLSWSDRRYQLRQYTFEPVDRFQRPVLVKAADYACDPHFTLPSLADTLGSTREDTEPPLPFPQADDMTKVIDVIDAVAGGARVRRAIARRYDFEERQADYYGNAATFLGLLTRTSGGFAVSRAGQSFVRSSRGERHQALLRRLAALPVFRRALEHLCARSALPTSELAAEWITSATGLSPSTATRRASTVLAWTAWADATTRQLEMAASPFQP